MLDCLRDGLLPEARAYAETFLRSNPYHLRALLVAGEVALLTGDLERSRSHLGTACAQYPGSADAHAGMAALLEVAGEPDKARAEALRAHELDPTSAAIAIQFSRLLQSDSQLEAAEAVLTRTLESSEAPDESVRVALANLAISRGDPAAALRGLSQPAVVSPQAVTTLALAHEKSGDWRAAARLHSQLLAQDPATAHKPAAEFARRALLENERAVAIGLGRQLARLGAPTTALCQELARTAPSDSPEPGLGALLDTVLGHLPISVPTSERTALTVALSRQLRLAGRPAEALKRVEGALDLDPGDAAAQEELFKQLYAAGELSRLQTRLEKITFRSPDSASAWCLLASTRIALQRALPAQEAAARACALEPAGFDARRSLARACKLAGEYERAIAEYKAALGLRPNDPRTLYELAATYTASGLQELASGQWRRLLDHVPEGSELATAAWRFLKRATS
ncbi:MAG: tetratricopeptide repeat protein [Candidatus Wallbacteria bacterium]|nr:tetratricopeptide repeat protein [Candidatus Wallbacteria bacterium]